MALEQHSGILCKNTFSSPVPFPTEFHVIGASVLDNGEKEGLIHWESFGGAILALAFVTEDKYEYIGSAVCVAPGVMISASHIFEDRKQGLFAGETLFVACAPTSGSLIFWTPYSVTEIGGTDLLIISMDIASPIKTGHKMSGFMMSTRTPAIGEKVSVVGFRPTHLEFREEPDDIVHFGGATYCSLGDVTEVYPNGRDQFMLPWPVFEIDCSTYGAMSGGAILDMNGCLIGILSSSFSGSGSNGPSYGSFLWDALDTKIKGGWRGLPQLPDFTTLRNMNKLGRACHIQRPEAVTPQRDGQSGYASCETWC